MDVLEIFETNVVFDHDKKFNKVNMFDHSILASFILRKWTDISYACSSSINSNSRCKTFRWELKWFADHLILYTRRSESHFNNGFIEPTNEYVCVLSAYSMASHFLGNSEMQWSMWAPSSKKRSASSNDIMPHNFGDCSCWLFNSQSNFVSKQRTLKAAH